MRKFLLVIAVAVIGVTIGTEDISACHRRSRRCSCYCSCVGAKPKRGVQFAHCTCLAADGTYARMWRLQQDQMQDEAVEAVATT